MKTVLVPCVCLLLATVGCRAPKKDDPASTTKVTAASTMSPSAAAPAAKETPAPKPFVPSHPVPPFAGKFPHRHDPAVDVASRAVEVKFARNGGEGDVAPLFALTNTSGKTVGVGQTWIFYYDAAGKLLDRYPHSLSGSVSLAPGETKEHRLGRDIKDLPKGTATIECEVTSASVDGAPWNNENLNPWQKGRPLGGIDVATLAEHAGERVIVDVYDVGSFRVRLTNVTDRPVKGVELRLFYADAKGARDSVSVRDPKLKEPLAPGKSIDLVLEPSFTRSKSPPPKAVSVVAFAPTVTFTDGSEFTNKTLLETRAWLGLDAR